MGDFFAENYRKLDSSFFRVLLAENYKNVTNHNNVSAKIIVYLEDGTGHRFNKEK